MPGLGPGCEKHVVWAGEPGVRTPVSLLYIHGFSATGQELRPLPDLVAADLGANLHFTRLTGHGQDGAAMGRATLADWTRDMAEALEIARYLVRLDSDRVNGYEHLATALFMNGYFHASIKASREVPSCHLERR